MGKVKKKLTSLLKAMNNYRVLICLQGQGALLFFFSLGKGFISKIAKQKIVLVTKGVFHLN